MRLTLIAIATVAVISPAMAKLPVIKMKIAEKHKGYEIDVSYPRTGNKAIDAAAAEWVKKEVADFKDEAPDGEAGSPMPYMLDITFDVPRNDDKVFAVTFSESIYEGGAHPNGFFNTMNFLMPDGWQVYLPEIFTPDGLKAISRLAIADLRKQLKPDRDFAGQMIADGAGPEWGNFADFTILPGTLDIQYPPYAVAPYVAGPQETKIPLAQLKPYLRADWRAPQASFDCVRASAWMEKIVCSDVTLARLDREVAEAYALRLGNANSDVSKKAVRSEQRAFLNSRTRKCGGQAGAGAVTCLIAQYRVRLKMLSGPAE